MDDLDAFFDDVSNDEAEAKERQDEIVDDGSKTRINDGVAVNPPPTKKIKTGNSSFRVRPRGVVVASSTSMPSKKTSNEDADNMNALKINDKSNVIVGSTKSALGFSTQQMCNVVGPLGVLPASITNNENLGNNMNKNSTIGTNNVMNGSSSNDQQQQNQNNETPYNNKNKRKGKNKKNVALRKACGKVWKDESLEEWPKNDYRLFVGNLTSDITDVELNNHFSKYSSLAKAKVIRKNNNNKMKAKGYGFVSLLDPIECAKAIREMDQSWLSSRPIRVRRSDWKDRSKY